MRLEWLPIVRNRAWHEFEVLASTDPTWILYETVRELAEGLPDRDDRFRLNRVLKTLSDAGYGDEEVAGEVRRSPYGPLHPYRMAVVSEPNEYGDVLMTLSFARGEKAFTITFVDRLGGRYYRVVAKESRFRARPHNRARAREFRWEMGIGPTREYPFDYVCQRVSELVDSKETCSDVNAGVVAATKALRKLAKDVPHPIDLYEAPSMSENQFRLAWRQCDNSKDWLLFLDEELPCMPEIARTTLDLKSSVDARATARYDIFRANLETFAQPWWMQDLVLRFKDLAYHLVERNQWDEAMQMIASARSVQEDGVNSPVFDSMLRHTAKVIPGYLSEQVLNSAQTKIAA